MADNSELVKAAEQLLAAAKEYQGDPLHKAGLLKQIDKIRYLAEGPVDTIFRQWDNVSISKSRASLPSKTPN